MDRMRDLVVAGNTARIADAAFVRELNAVAAMLGITLLWPFASGLFRVGPLHWDDLALTLGVGTVVHVVLEIAKPIRRANFDEVREALTGSPLVTESLRHLCRIDRRGRRHRPGTSRRRRACRQYSRHGTVVPGASTRTSTVTTRTNPPLPLAHEFSATRNRIDGLHMGDWDGLGEV